MTMLDSRLEQDQQERTDEGTASLLVDGARWVRRWCGARLTTAWAASLAVAWAIVFPTALALEPTPDEADATPAVVGVVLSLVLVAWAFMAVGLWRRQRLGAAASLVAAVGLLTVAIACPVSGHHSTLAAWWWFELAGVGVLLALSRAAIRSARPAPPAG
jgi:Na+-transporting NADH:ubiquinone oxidoreductase subunit NqrB